MLGIIVFEIIIVGTSIIISKESRIEKFGTEGLFLLISPSKWLHGAGDCYTSGFVTRVKCRMTKLERVDGFLMSFIYESLRKRINDIFWDKKIEE